MAPLSVDQQIAGLRPAMGVAAQLHNWLLVGAALCASAAILIWHPWPMMVSVFLAIVGVSERKAGPNLVAAVSAYDSAAPSLGEVTISVTRWDVDDHYRARVREPNHPDWEFQFVPQGWKPAPRTCPARIWRTAGNGPPVLAVIEEGVMIPRYEPKLVALATREPRP